MKEIMPQSQLKEPPSKIYTKTKPSVLAERKTEAAEPAILPAFASKLFSKFAWKINSNSRDSVYKKFPSLF